MKMSRSRGAPKLLPIVKPTPAKFDDRAALVIANRLHLLDLEREAGK